MPEDAYCVRFYEEIRRNVGPDARRLGVGRNLFPPSAALQRHLGIVMRALIHSDRFSHYESEADACERALVAELVDQYLGRQGVEAEDVFFTNGAQEGISVVCGYGARSRLEAVLPLPVYYSYEQSSHRWGMPVAGYYRRDGADWWSGEPSQRLLQVLVLPNAVTGGIFQPPGSEKPSANLKAELTLIDCVYQLGTYGEANGLTKYAREVVRSVGLERSVLIFTASKDLAMPGLRSGLLVTKNKELILFARADRFERTYSLNPLVGQVMALYLSLLLLNDWGSDQQSLTRGSHADLVQTFRDCNVAFPVQSDAEEILTHFRHMTDHNRENLSMLTSADLPLRLKADRMPVAGYSVFPDVSLGFGDSASFISWIRKAGVSYRLKLNPAYLFGGTPEIWSALYPGQYSIRVNVSEKRDDLAVALACLSNAASAAS